MTWRRHSCLRRRDSSRRAGTVDAAREEGRDESRPSRQECLRHENGLIPNSTTSGVLQMLTDPRHVCQRAGERYRNTSGAAVKGGPHMATGIGAVPLAGNATMARVRPHFIRPENQQNRPHHHRTFGPILCLAPETRSWFPLFRRQSRNRTNFRALRAVVLRGISANCAASYQWNSGAGLRTDADRTVKV